MALRLRVENWRWAGVPVYVRTGKRLPARVTEVALQFHSVPFLAFKGELARQLQPNALVLRIQPNEGISLHFGAKVPGEAFRVQSVAMDFDYDEAFANTGEADGYPRLLHDAMCGDATLFIRTDEVDQAWRIVDPYLDGLVRARRRPPLLRGRHLGAPRRRPPPRALRRHRGGSRSSALDRAHRGATTSPGPSPTWWRGPFAERPGARFSLVLSGGPLARACYERLAARPRAPSTGRPVDVYLGDERLVPPDDPDANQRLVREALVEPVGGVGSFTPMPTEGDPDAAPTAYDAVLAAVLAGPGLDLVHLGMGPDGHTASLFPGAPSLEAGPDRLVVATEDPDGANPHPRLTLTLAGHRPGPAGRLHGRRAPPSARRWPACAAGDDIPAARVRAPEVRWLVDAEALGVPS